MRETTISDIERINVAILVLGSIASIAHHARFHLRLQLRRGERHHDAQLPLPEEDHGGLFLQGRA